MDPAHIKAILEGVVPELKKAVAASQAPVIERLNALEEHKPKDGERGADGLNGKDGRDGVDGKDGAPGAPGVDGKDGVPGPAGIDGKDGRAGIDGNDGSPGRDGVDGKDGERGADGLNGKDGRDGVDGKDGAAGRDGSDGKDGERGADGLNGKDGRDAADLAVIMQIAGEKAAEAVVSALSTLSASTEDGGRTIKLSIAVGDREVVTSIKTDIVLDRGVWREGAFVKGDGVSLGGSFFIAQEDTTDKPETSKAWRLAVKRGRDGQNGKNGDRGPGGPKGDKGDPGPRGYAV